MPEFSAGASDACGQSPTYLSAGSRDSVCFRHSSVRSEPGFVGLALRTTSRGLGAPALGRNGGAEVSPFRSHSRLTRQPIFIGLGSFPRTKASLVEASG